MQGHPGKAVLQALWQVPVGFFAPASPVASDAGMAVLTGKRDYDRVKRDLRAAGYNGEKIVLLVAADEPDLKGYGDVAADMLKRVGMVARSGNVARLRQQSSMRSM